MRLLRYKNIVPTVFDLVGTKENDVTACLAYVLARSPVFFRGFIREVTGVTYRSVHDGLVQIQTSRRGEGITDVEIQLRDKFFCVIEAKRGAELPHPSQLSLYAQIVRRKSAEHSVLITVSNATPEFANIKLNPPVVDDVPVLHRSWRQLKSLAVQSRDRETNTNKRLLDEFVLYLERLLGLETRSSNMVYVVSLAHGNPDRWSLSWIDIVEKRDRYFYPVGERWPDPPNYLGFRYNGKLQCIRHVDEIGQFDNPHTVFPEAPDEHWEPHYLFHLGPPIVPSHTVRNGPRIRMANRCWCMIDTLLTAKTISDALTETQKRLSTT